MLYGMTRPSAASEFLDEIPPEYKNFSAQASQLQYKKEFADTEYERPVRDHDFYSPGRRAAEDFVKKKTEQKAEKMFFRPGDRVSHAVFGDGTVEKCEKMGGDALVTVLFDSGVEKNLMASFAKLKSL